MILNLMKNTLEGKMDYAISTIKSSFSIFSENMSLLIGIFCGMFLISSVIGIISPDFENGLGMQYLLFSLASKLFSMGLSLGAIKIVLDVISAQPTGIKKLFECFHLLIPYVGAYFLLSLIYLILFIPFSNFMFTDGEVWSLILSMGSKEPVSFLTQIASKIQLHSLILFLIPTFYLWIRFQFFTYLIVKEECGPVEAIKKSYAITEGKSGMLLIFLLFLMCINLVGIIPLGLGLIFTIPFSLLSTGVMFAQLVESKSQNA
jgi:uncharacterized membrane protein